MKKKSILVFALIFVMLFGNTLAVSASVPNLSSNKYIKTYPLSTSNNTYVYTSASLTKRGTSYPYKAYNAVIYASDEIYVYSMNNTYAYISYPTSSGRRYGYIRTSAITSKNKNASSTYKSRAKINTYKKAGGAYYGYIAKGDTVYTVASSGNYVQVIYPTGSTYKMGWVTASNYNKYIATSSNSNSNNTSNQYIKTYPLSTSNNTYVYTNSSLTKRGTSSPYKAYNAVIYASDEIYVYSMNNTYAYISYPTSSGRRYGYIKTSAITSKNKSTNSAYTSRAQVNTYKKAGGAYYGYISKGDTVYTIASSGNYVQVIYPTGSTYKMGWVTASNYNKYIAKGGSSYSGGNTNSNSSVKVSLNVPSYKQYDSRWKNKCIGNHTIGSIGCLLTSCAMKYSYQTGTTTYPTAMKNKLRFSNNDLIWSSVSNVGFRYTNQYNCSINNSIMKTIYQQLKAGKPVIIGGRSARGGYHYVVVTGYRGSSATSFKASDFTINDPNSSSRTTLSQFTAVYYRIDRLVY